MEFFALIGIICFLYFFNKIFFKIGDIIYFAILKIYHFFKKD